MTASLLPDPVSVTVRAPAKINLYLGVGQPRGDGFHPLETVYQAVSLYDDVTVTDAAEWSVATVVDTPHIDAAEVPDDDGNIAIRAGRALVEHHRVERAAEIRIRKAIPVAGGMAGGSADAAATLVALDRLWSLGTTDEELLTIAAGLGSDVPFALLGGTATGTGRGEIVTPIEDDNAWWWVVVLSDEGLLTSSVYGAYDLLEYGDHDYRIQPAMLDAMREGWPPEELTMFLYNDLEVGAYRIRADLERVAEAAEACGALWSLLSGSGPTVLALARGAEHAREVAGRLAERGYERTTVVHGPVAGAHVVTYD